MIVKIKMKRLSVLFSVGSVVLLLRCGLCFAEGFKFDPATCKENTGNLYVALGRYVFATPSSTANVVIDPVPETKSLKAPDPSQPMGCLGNPLQSNSHYLFHPLTVATNVPGQSRPSFPIQLGLYNLRRNSPAADKQDREWPGESLERLIEDRVCRTATLREDLASGLLACRIKPADPSNVRQEDWAASYLANQEIYKTPLGKPFVVNCGPGSLSSGFGYCDVSYMFNSGIGVSYRFQPYIGNHPIPIDQIIAYDKSLRSAVESALVKDYRWSE